MYKLGDIVCFDNLIFEDGVRDKKTDRPCMVLCTYTTSNDEELLFCMPFTSQIKNFNKRPYSYFIVPDIIFSVKKLSFVKINNLFVKNISDAKDTGLSVNLSKESINNLRSKINRYSKKEGKYYSIVELILDYNEKIDENDTNNISKKLERKLKKIMVKENIM